MSFQYDPSSNAKIQKDLEDLPDKVAEALEVWRIATLDRERTEALLYCRLKAENESWTGEMVKNGVRSSDERYKAVLVEIKAEAKYNKIYENLMSAKKIASLRTAF